MASARALALALAGGLLFAAPAAAGVDVGDKAPDVNPKEWWNHRPTSLAKLRGKAVLLEFWATW